MAGDGDGGCFQLETGRYADAEEGSEHDAGALDCYGQELKLAPGAITVVRLVYFNREELAFGTQRYEIGSQGYARDVLVEHRDVDNDTVVELNVDATANVNLGLHAKNQVNRKDDAD